MSVVIPNFMHYHITNPHFYNTLFMDMYIVHLSQSTISSLFFNPISYIVKCYFFWIMEQMIEITVAAMFAVTIAYSGNKHVTGII